ncbi:porin family protein [Chryseobacterium sp. RG1]|uniref:Porin family protein n=1 Tax=Chryseobacterium tagetis TaxID=2801334 RepID=A0ABS7ZWQ2_9FLAO|nr:outer membrane beta-barrel protein [Chryseobacterium tagetis]MCA6066141.1 porin family protein [Chryseobacterium tagetis]
MKKLLLASAIALFGLSNAQIAKGTTYLSGVVNYSSTQDNNTDSKVEKFTITPTVGYFVGTNLAVGLGVGYTTATNTSTSPISTVETKISDDAFVVKPFVRKYWTLGDKLYIFGQLEVPMAFGKEKSEYSGTASQYNTENKYTSIGVNVKPGLDYFLNKNWSIEATIGEFGYNNFKYKDLDKSTDNFNFGLNLSSVTFGVKYVFAK